MTNKGQDAYHKTTYNNNTPELLLLLRRRTYGDRLERVDVLLHLDALL